ncbi:45729_t:CDS:2, partial [Gigaspora margarita]
VRSLKKISLFCKKRISKNDEIEGTKALMRHLFETEYVASFNDNMSFSISGNTMKSRTQSILDDDFEEDEENTDELDHYILEKPASKKIDSENIACDYLAIQGSSTASEHAFSLEKNIITNKRTNLVPKTVRASQCLQSWLQGLLKGRLEF